MAKLLLEPECRAFNNEKGTGIGRRLQPITSRSNEAKTEYRGFLSEVHQFECPKSVILVKVER